MIRATGPSAPSPEDPARPTVLFIFNDSERRARLTSSLGKSVFDSAGASTWGDAASLMRERPPDLIVCEWPPAESDDSGLDSMKRLDVAAPVIAVTSRGDLEAAANALREGAFDYSDQDDDPAGLPVKIATALARRRMMLFPALEPTGVAPKDRFGAMIGRSETMLGVFRRLAKVAPLGSTILILGESGTGKEVAAREIHNRSAVAGGPFVAINCGGMPGDLIEAELFGHERGAFTGAVTSRDGLFQTAQGGTLFLDEIGVMPLAQQSSLLRALQEKEIRRIGSRKTIKVDVRVIAATNRDLDAAMDDGSFRQDLYYRLSNVVIHLPPLRERVADIPLLAAHFLEKVCERHSMAFRRLSLQTLDLLCGKSWPGNLRELENVMEQAVIFSAREVIRPKDLSRSVAGLLQEDHPDTLDDLEKRHIATILRRTSGNKVQAARILGIPRSSLYRKLKRIDPES